MLGITAFGWIHTVISLLAMAAAAVAFARHGGIALATSAGRAFVGLTVASCVTGLFIFHHGGFGPPHVLALVTLGVLGVAALAERRRAFGGASAYVATAACSLAFFFHFIPGFTETLTRLPLAAPYASGPDDPKLQALIGATFAVFVIGILWQLLRLRRASRTLAPART
ncbi:hypothetical protein [Tahibacter caeni]|uniref:hypothetical protein n=1 Tax=Tahibacter caeni TaxID=1453545 RepID=UPI0021490AFD|nr:hypothetical protein [Tahibacter caeni]